MRKNEDKEKKEGNGERGKRKERHDDDGQCFMNMKKSTDKKTNTQTNNKTTSYSVPCSRKIVKKKSKKKKNYFTGRSKRFDSLCK